MAVKFEMMMRCEYCGAEITYVNERPAWKEDEEIKTRIEAAKEWVAANPTSSWGETLPPYVARNLLSGQNYVPYRETLYVDCPCCDAPVFRGDGQVDGTDDQGEGA